MTARGENELIVFLKQPIEGRVKKRLAATIGHEAAVALYRCFVSDTLAAARRSGYPTTAFVHPPGAGAVAWLGGGVLCRPQQGHDLGERMLHAFQEAFSRSSRAVLIGSDCPDLPPAFLREAFDGLKARDAVLGPAADGGYYLVGFSSPAFLPAIFKDIEWGGPKVFEATMTIFREKGVDIHVLPVWSDVDDYADLEALYGRCRNVPAGQLSTIDFLRNHFHYR